RREICGWALERGAESWFPEILRLSPMAGVEQMQVVVESGPRDRSGSSGHRQEYRQATAMRSSHSIPATSHGFKNPMPSCPDLRFNDQYGLQVGAGPAGDLPNDFKFEYGGIVLRGPALAQPQYDIYGALFILVPDSDPSGTRVFPPFQGNGGGPSGGPLFQLKGKNIDAFVHLTSVRPGTVLETGDTFSIAGAVAPALPGLVSATITLPSGAVVRQSGRANRVG